MIPFNKLEKVVEGQRYKEACEHFKKLSEKDKLKALFDPFGPIFDDIEFEDIPW